MIGATLALMLMQDRGDLDDQVRRLRRELDRLEERLDRLSERLEESEAPALVESFAFAIVPSEGRCPTCGRDGFFNVIPPGDAFVPAERGWRMIQPGEFEFRTIEPAEGEFEHFYGELEEEQPRRPRREHRPL